MYSKSAKRIENSPTDVEVGDLEALLLGQIQHHLDVVGVGDAQRASPQRTNLLRRGVFQTVDLDAPLRGLKYNFSERVEEERAGSFARCEDEGRAMFAYPRDFRRARQTLELGHHFLRRGPFRSLFGASGGCRHVAQSALTFRHNGGGRNVKQTCFSQVLQLTPDSEFSQVRRAGLC